MTELQEALASKTLLREQKDKAREPSAGRDTAEFQVLGGQPNPVRALCIYNRKENEDKQRELQSI